jgi:3-oxoacyl-[acyl-carrier-protein] synthase II
MVTYAFAVSDPIAVTGIGVVSPFGAATDAFCDALLAGASGVAPITRFDATRCRTRAAASVADFDPTRWIPPMKLRRLDRTGMFAVAAVNEAFAHARLDLRPEGEDRMGVVLGTYSAGGQTSHDYLDGLHRGGPSGAPALLFHSTVGNAAASLAAMERKLRGPNVTVSQKEASGLAAVASAVDLLRESRADVIAAGGVDAVFELFFKAHDLFGVMAPGDPPEAASRPFDGSRNGFVMGEGAYVLTLTRPGVAARGQPILGEILGVGIAGAAVPLNAWPADPEPVVRAMRLALADAGVPPEAVDVVFASANSTRLVDEIEAQALLQLLPVGTPVTSIKGALGECGASGAASLAAALLCAGRGAVPPVVNLAEPDGACAELTLVRSAMALPGPLMLVNSIGSGGSLVSAVVRAAAPEAR